MLCWERGRDIDPESDLEVGVGDGGGDGRVIVFLV